MAGIKNLLFGIALLITGLYGIIGGWFLILSYICLPLGAIYCIYGLIKENEKK